MSSIESPLAGILAERIRREGPLTFREFMEAALYHPEHGYYCSGRAAIGREGDYFTSVSTGPLFGKLLARQFAEMWRVLGQPERWSIVEQGAHCGEFAADALGELQLAEPAAFGAANYVIVEPSPRLAKLQQERLKSFAGKVSWRRSIAELEPVVGVHFSNELLDALPVHRVIRRAGGWAECYVDVQGGRFAFQEGPASSASLAQQLAELPDAPEGYATEVNLAASSWIQELSPKITRGFVLAIDYGFSRAEYYRAERSDGTLTGYSQHRREADLLARPGEVDLTAHVDFSAVASEAERLGWQLHGFTDQHHLMVGLSRLYFHETDALTPERERELRAFKTLMHPDLMGRSFKALCLQKELAKLTPLAGFAFAQNSRGSLGIEMGA